MIWKRRPESITRVWPVVLSVRQNMTTSKGRLNQSGPTGILQLQDGISSTGWEKAMKPGVIARVEEVSHTEQLVHRAQNGDLAAFEALYRAHVGRVYALCLRLSGNADRAEELTQRAFIRVWEQLGTFRGESAFSSWLYRLAVNVVLTARRSERRRMLRVRTAEDPEIFERSFGNATSPDTGIDLERAIARLPQGARTVFVLHDVEGYQHGEIAEMTGMSVGTSKAQLHRARKLLREALER